MSQTVNPLAMMAAASSGSSQADGKKWFEAMAEAWGKTLNAKATQLEEIASVISGGDDRPATITQLSTYAQQMNFLSQGAHSSISSVGSALEAMARKQ
jgi:hypothetical protein